MEAEAAATDIKYLKAELIKHARQGNEEEIGKSENSQVVWT